MVKYYQTLGGHYYKEYNNGKKKRISQQIYYKNTMKGGATTNQTNNIKYPIELPDEIVQKISKKYRIENFSAFYLYTLYYNDPNSKGYYTLEYYSNNISTLTKYSSYGKLLSKVKYDSIDKLYSALGCSTNTNNK
jgi:hypothetical protein